MTSCSGEEEEDQTVTPWCCSVRLTSLDQLWFLVCFIFSVEQHKDLIDLCVCVLCVGSGGHGLSPPLSPTVMSLVHRALTGEGSIRIIFVSVLEVTLAVVFTAVTSQLVHHLTPVELPVPAAVRMLLLPVACTQIYQEFHCLIQHCSGPSKTHRCFTLCQDNI